MIATSKRCIDFTKCTWLIRSVVSEIRHAKHIRATINEIRPGKIRISVKKKKQQTMLWVADYSDSDDVWLCYGGYDNIGCEKTEGWCTYGTSPGSVSSIENCVRLAVERCILCAIERNGNIT